MTETIPPPVAYVFDPARSSTIAVPADNACLSEPSSPPEGPLDAGLLERMIRYWQAANYLTVGQIYLRENPLLREPLTAEQIKPRLLGH